MSISAHLTVSLVSESTISGKRIYTPLVVANHILVTYIWILVAGIYNDLDEQYLDVLSGFVHEYI